MKKMLVVLLSALVLMMTCAWAEEVEPPVYTCGDWQYTLLEDGTAEIVAYRAKATELTIPAELDGLAVTSIGDSAFSRCRSLTSLTLPDFVTSIGDYAFRECSSLTSLTLPDTVTSIGDSAFYWCDSLTSITLSDSVTTIGANPFAACEMLTDIIVSPDHPTLAMIDGVLFYKPEKRLVCYPWAYPADSYTVPEGTQVIGDSAFFWCRNLTRLTLPDSVTIIGDKAFSDCYALTSIALPDSVTSIGDRAFSKCESLTSITLPAALTSIGDRAFNNCQSLTSITLPDSVTSIGANPFIYCENLTDIIVSPEHPTLATINGVLFYKPEERLVCYPCVYTVDSYIVPQGVLSIGDSAFYGCYTLTSITMPDSVTSIGDDAFAWCHALTIPQNTWLTDWCEGNAIPYTYAN